MLEALQDVDEVHAKLVKKEYEGVNESIGRFFKRTSKDEKAFDDMMASLNGRVVQTTAAYQSVTHSTSSSRDMHAALDNITSQHVSYMQQLSNLSYQIQQAKLGYGEAIAERREPAVKEVARVMCRLAEGEWRTDIEGVRKGGQKIGRLANAAVWVHPEISPALVTTPGEVFGERDNSTNLRGPRGPSTGTNDSFAPPAAPSSTTTVPPLRQNPPSYRSDLILQSSSSETYAASPQPVSPRTVPQNDNAALRRPIPRYGSAPAVPSAAQADEFGRIDRSDADTRGDAKPQRQDSFVARMSAKYSSASVSDPHMPQPAPQQLIQSSHSRSDSRVSLLAKRYSSPPDATFPSSSHCEPTMPASPPQLPAARPTHRHSHSLDPSRPPFAQQQAYAHVVDSAPSLDQRQPTPKRLRAYQVAQPLPSRQHDPSIASGYSSGTVISSTPSRSDTRASSRTYPTSMHSQASLSDDRASSSVSASGSERVETSQRHSVDEEGVSVLRE